MINCLETVSNLTLMIFMNINVVEDRKTVYNQLYDVKEYP